MGYTTAVTDWVSTDYFDVQLDWPRLYRNTQLASSLSEIELSVQIDFTMQGEYTNTDIPVVTNFNNLLAAMETMRLAVAGESIAGTTTEIKDDYVAGQTEVTFDYSDANLWESTVDAIWSHWNGSSYDVAPTLTGDLTVTTGNTEIIIDSLDAANYNIDLQGTASLYIL